jgi:glycosyltransferase involved in cell wall biosynthesis
VEEPADHYRLCDVFAMPSTGEGFGIVFLEAMACGKPVIGGTRDSAVDALRHGELGVLVDPEDPAQLRDALVSVLVGKAEMLNGATGASDIEGKATREGVSERGQRANFKTDILKLRSGPGTAEF